MTGTLLYLAYGDSREVHLELTFSILTAVQKSGQRSFRVVVASDRNRDDLPVEQLTWTSEEFDRWTLGGRFHHGAKVGALAKALDVYGGKIALIDTDTYFKSDPARIFERIAPDTVVMHEDEGLLSGQGPWRAVRHPRIGGSARMINSGVVGVDASARPLLDEVFAFMCELYEVAPEIHTLEQFAFGHVFAQSGRRIVSCSDVVRHYWGYSRPFIHARLARLFPDFTAERFNRCLPQDFQVEGFPRRRRRDLLRAKIKQLARRQSDMYRFAYLAYLSSRSATSSADAQAWETVARNAIRWNEFPSDIVAVDFKGLAA